MPEAHPSDANPWGCMVSPELTAQAAAVAERRFEDVSYTIHGRVARLAIHGVVSRTNPSPGYHQRHGFPTHREIESALVRIAANAEVLGVVLDVDSPGGDLIGSLQLMERVESLATKKPLVVFSGGLLCAMAYNFAASAHYTIAAPNATVGGLGLCTGQHLDIPAAFYADSQIARARRGRRFAKHALTASVLAGDCFSGDAALNAGLIDKIGTLLDAFVTAHNLVDMNRAP